LDVQIEVVRLVLIVIGVSIGLYKGIEGVISSSNLRGELDKKDKRIEELENVTRNTEDELEGTRRKLAESEDRLLKLKESVVDRIVPRERVDELVGKLSGLRKAPIGIGCVNGNDEACKFAHEIRLIFAAAGWDTKDTRITYLGPPVIDTIVWVRNEEMRGIARDVLSILDFVKVSSLQIKDNFDRDIVMTIGAKSVR
jgi:hypothetical protein